MQTCTLKLFESGRFTKVLLYLKNSELKIMLK